MGRPSRWLPPSPGWLWRLQRGRDADRGGLPAGQPLRARPDRRQDRHAHRGGGEQGRAPHRDSHPDRRRTSRSRTEALIYDGQGVPWVYTEVSRLTYRRVKVAVDRTDAERVLLTSGPPPGTRGRDPGFDPGVRRRARDGGQALMRRHRLGESGSFAGSCCSSPPGCWPWASSGFPRRRSTCSRSSRRLRWRSRPWRSATPPTRSSS